jgi:DNA ligase D-like protein (predicted 3'-phosphoesterase)
MNKTHPLEIYHRKRDFKKTPEPSGKKKLPARKKEPLFVIQKHAARRLHYDFRLEVSGVLKSWAVPKGPSLDPADRRLAMMTEDHPMDYARFEGVIPQGNYGAGNVIVWDFGTYVNLCHDARTKKIISMEEGLRRGHAMVWLKGKKLQGSFILTRMKIREEKGKVPWLLIKVKDGAEDLHQDIAAERPESVFSGFTVEAISRKPRIKRWTSNRAAA